MSQLILQDYVYDAVTKAPIKIDTGEIIKSRALFQANSGGGKSYLLRKFLEVTHGLVQHIILDPEGEFHTLREKFDYLYVAKGEEADIQLSIAHAPLLAKRIMETNANVIIDLYELNKFERVRYVKAFLEALVNLPKSLWHPCFIVLDEIHDFAPESSKSESLDAVASLASKGRKRGYALIGATQKLSKFHKDVAAELNTKFTGRCTLDIDQKRAAAELGIKEYTSLRNLDHEFYVFGPAVVEKQQFKVKAYKVTTTHEDIGSATVTHIADEAKIKKLKESFKDLPQEAINELKTVDDLKRKIAEQSQTIRQIQRQPASSSIPKIDPAALQKAEAIGYQKGWKECQKELLQIKNNVQRYIKILESKLEFVDLHMDAMRKRLESFPKFPAPQFDIASKETKLPPLPKEIKTPYPQKTQPVITKSAESTNSLLVDSEGELSGPELKVIKALLSLPHQRGTKVQAAFAADYTNPASGGFRNPCGALRTKGLLEYEGDLIIATQAAQLMFPDVQPLDLTQDNIQNFWLSRLPGPEQKILKPVMDAYPNSIPRQDAAAQAGYTNVNSGGFRNPVGHLRSLNLIDYVGADRDLVATKELFPDV